MKEFCTEEIFLNDVEAHRLEILVDDGLRRHLKFRRPETYSMGFDIITWPGYLCYCGDMGTYVFSRIADMFEFFRTDRKQPRPGKTLCINRQYWAEKVQAADKSDGIEEFDADLFRSVVVERHREWVRDCGDRYAVGDRIDLRQELRSQVLCESDNGEQAAVRAAMDFYHRQTKFSMDDFYDHRMRRYTQRFTWCCYALAWGILQYDESKEEVTA